MHTGVCRVPDPRPSPYTLHRGPVDGGPVHRKIRPPGASRRRATDNHVTLLLYRYRSRRHNTAPRPTVPPPLCAARGGKRGRAKKKSSSILVTNRFDIFLLLFIQLNAGCPRAETAARGGWRRIVPFARLWGCESRLPFFFLFVSSMEGGEKEGKFRGKY